MRIVRFFVISIIFKFFVEYAISFNEKIKKFLNYYYIFLMFYICLYIYMYENIFKMIVNNNCCRIKLIEIYEKRKK